MSITPIFDATLADAPVNIWEASNIFPRPAGAPESLQQALIRIGHTTVPPLQPDYRDWKWINIPLTKGAVA